MIYPRSIKITHVQGISKKNSFIGGRLLQSVFAVIHCFVILGFLNNTCNKKRKAGIYREKKSCSFVSFHLEASDFLLFFGFL